MAAFGILENNLKAGIPVGNADYHSSKDGLSVYALRSYVFALHQRKTEKLRVVRTCHVVACTGSGVKVVKVWSLALARQVLVCPVAWPPAGSSSQDPPAVRTPRGGRGRPTQLLLVHYMYSNITSRDYRYPLLTGLHGSAIIHRYSLSTLHNNMHV